MRAKYDISSKSPNRLAVTAAAWGGRLARIEWLKVRLAATMLAAFAKGVAVLKEF